MYTLLSCLAFLILQTPTLPEAKLQSDGFVVDLIHRYSPKSPYYNSSMTLQERFHRLAHGSSSRYHYLNWLKNTSTDTALIQSEGDYLMKVSVGVPPIEQFVIADTGSDLIWVQCKPCDDCYPQKYAMFDPKQSSTFGILPCNSTFCLSVPQNQCIYSDECEYWYAYGDGLTLTSGIMVTDVFTFSTTSENLNSSLVFGCGFEQQGDFYENETGIVGLSPGPLSLISQLGSSIDNSFSYCLTPSTSNFTSKLRLGTHVAAKQGAVTVTVPLSSKYSSEFYAITLKAISIGQTRVEVDRDIVIDNGSTLTSLDPGIYSKLEKAVKEAISAKPMTKPPVPDLSLCYDVKSGFTPPANITLHLSQGDILLNSTNFLIDSGDSVCLAIVPSSEENDDIMILGNVAQVNFEVEFNLDSKTVSFTPADCALGDNSE